MDLRHFFVVCSVWLGLAGSALAQEEAAYRAAKTGGNYMHNYYLPAASSTPWRPSWSPDGRYIAFSSNRRGPYNIYIMQGSGENQQRLTASGGDDKNPAWSPRLE